MWFPLTLLVMCIGGLFQKCWGSFPLLLRVPPAQPTQREHSYQVQTAICSAGALRHAPHGIEISVTITHIRLVLNMIVSVMPQIVIVIMVMRMLMILLTTVRL